MYRELLVRKTSVRLNIPEDIVDKVYMFQCQKIKEAMRDPDVTDIFVPNFGSFKFRYKRAAGVFPIWENTIEKLKKELETEPDVPRQISLMNRIEGLEGATRLLKLKVSYTSPKYGGYRERLVEKQIPPDIKDRVQELKKDREDEKIKYIMEFPDGYNQRISSILSWDEQEVSQRKSNILQDKV